MSRSDRIIPVVGRKTATGKFNVVTEFLGDAVGNYLGKSTDLTEDEANSLAVKWIEMQKENRLKASGRRVKVKTQGLTNWEYEEVGEEL